MKLLDREITTVVSWVLENIVPPFIKDRFWFMYPFVWIAYGKHTKTVMGFKKEFPFLSDEEIATYYDLIKDDAINERDTDLNKKSLSYIVKNLFKDGGGGRKILCLIFLVDAGFCSKKLWKHTPTKNAQELI
jgi:DNA modification methylase